MTKNVRKTMLTMYLLRDISSVILLCYSGLLT
jgi:hypothetical protein